MAPRKPEAGSRWRSTTMIGQGPGLILAGQSVTVREVVPADEPGAGDTSEDSVVVEWEEAAPVHVDTLEPDDADAKGATAELVLGMGKAPRAWAVPLSTFRDTFEEA
jgi:hypothetical protein